MKRIVIAACLALAACTTGCASLGPSPEQIKAMEGTSSSLCVKAGPSLTAGAGIEAHYASYGGRSTGTAGGGGQATCGSSTVTFNNEGKLAPGAPKAPTTEGAK